MLPLLDSNSYGSQEAVLPRLDILLHDIGSVADRQRMTASMALGTP